MLVCILISMFALCTAKGMEEQGGLCNITIQTTKESYSMSYNHKTAILDIKSNLERSEGIPIEQQKLIAVVPSTDWYCDTIADFMATTSDSLANDATIQEIIKNYGTGVYLKLYLTLHKNPYKEK